MNGVDNGAGRTVETVFCSVVAYVKDGFADYALYIDVSRCRDFTHYHDKTGRAACFARNTGHRVGFEHFIEDAVGDLVADFVGMSFGNRFGCEEFFHFLPSFLCVAAESK